MYGSVSGLLDYREDAGRYLAMTRDDSKNIQIIINVVLRSLTNLDNETPVRVMLEKSGFLSFHQMCAFSTVCMTRKIIISKQPSYLYDILHESMSNNDIRRSKLRSNSLNYKLSASRESFLFQAVRLYSRLPDDVVRINNIQGFKRKARIWIRENIPIYM